MTYSFKEADDFLRHEAQITPEELYDEITTAMSNLAAIENKRNYKVASSIWETLLTCADFFERINRKEARREKDRV